MIEMSIHTGIVYFMPNKSKNSFPDSQDPWGSEAR